MSRPQRGHSRGIGNRVGKGAPQCGHRQNRTLTYTPVTAITMGGRKSHTVWRLISSFAGVLGCVSTRNNAQMTNKRPPPAMRSQIWRDSRRRLEATNTSRNQSISRKQQPNENKIGPPLARANVAWNGRVFIKESEAVLRPGVGCIAWLDGYLSSCEGLSRNAMRQTSQTGQSAI